MLLALISLALLGDIYDETPLTINPYPDQIPETYQEWLSGQPEPVPLNVRTIVSSDADAEFIVIFEAGLTDSLEAGMLDQWIGDIALQGLEVEVVEITYTEPEEIREYLTGLWNDGLEGGVLVGNLPVPWSLTDDNKTRAGEMFPSDYFYMDLNGDWEDLWIGYPSEMTPGTDGIYDTWSGDLGPEIYMGRMKLDNLTSVGDPTDMLNTYLQRNHEWRLNGDPGPLTALCYVDNDWSYWGSGYATAMGYLYDDVVLVNQVDSTNGTDYLENRLPGEYVWISPFVHSGPWSHAWEPGPSTQWNQIIPAMPQARFYNLFACSNARFTTPRNMGSVYTFGTSTGLASVGSTKSGAMLSFGQFYFPLSLGDSMGEAYSEWWEYIAAGGLTPSEEYWHLGMVVLGDPTLIPAMHMLGIEEGPATGGGNLQLMAYGNPCRGSAVFRLNSPVTGSAALYDTFGRMVVETGAIDGECSFDVSGLAGGMYMARVTVEGVSATASVVVLNN